MLTEAFSIFADTCSVHEPEPNYATVLPRVKENPRYALDFLDKKLKAIEDTTSSNYVETSNVFGKGFLIPLLRQGIFPNLIFLNRDFRETAKSLYKRGSTPMRTKRGAHFSADPRVPGSLPIFSPDTLSDYQLCYWGVLDSYFRQIEAKKIYDQEEQRYCWVTADDFHDFDFTISVGSHFGLQVENQNSARILHSKITSKHHNPNAQEREIHHTSLLKEELEVIDRIAFFNPLFIDEVLSSSFISAEVKSKVTS
ncbi:hypothetical protein [Chromohalobacter sp. HP20-39]|uniref:hypothetical protein n=1 Tax=Chromohalobacter sp. HP20-39 TaxID=3079306 RepID=UPI00294B357B|nr:hypothetical protein [Chromohalobacter sp. HP20-39]MDV6319140.1 hypothetical protein [Chromohalobacter sp. HP20-39]